MNEYARKQGNKQESTQREGREGRQDGGKEKKEES